MKPITYLFFISVFFISCNTKSKTTKYIIASQTTDCVGVTPQKCLLVKKGNATEWEYFYSPIEGFQYEEGYEYVLEIKEQERENIPADASSIRYILVKEISKTARTSEKLPDPVIANQSIQWTGKVLDIEKNNIGQGAAQGRFSVVVLKIEVTSSNSEKFKESDTIYCELTGSPKVNPEKGREYAFKAKNIHPAHAKGIYLLETEI